jgi:trigger factor
MQTSIEQVKPTEYALEIKATAEDLSPEMEKALREQRGRTTLKGFRPGKVPLSLVKKIYGKAIAYVVAEELIQKTYESEVLGKDTYRVLGQPVIDKIDFNEDNDLHATVRFGVRPEFELKDLSSEEIIRYTHTVDEEEIDERIEEIRIREADLVPVEGPAEEDNFLTIDVQPLDDATNTPVIGARQKGVTIFLDDRIAPQLREALIGTRTGDTIRVDIPHEGHHHDEEEHESALLITPESEHKAHTHTHRYEIAVKEIKRRDLPELDEELIKKVTNGLAENVEDLRKILREELEQSWKFEIQRALTNTVIDKMLELHPIPVPESLVNSFLDSYVEDVKSRNNGRLPEDLDEDAFREVNRSEAERQARWMLIEDRIVETEKLEVTDEDRKAYIEETRGAATMTADEMLGLYRQVPRLLDQLDQRILSRKVIDLLAGRFKVVEKPAGDAAESDLDDESFEEE